MTNRTSDEIAALRQAMAGEFLNLHELIAKARVNLNQNNWDYIVGATESETTMRRNRLALDAIALRPRVLRDVSNIDASVEFLGRRLRLPVLLCPVGTLETFDPGGGATVVRAAHEFGVAHMQRLLLIVDLKRRDDRVRRDEIGEWHRWNLRSRPAAADR